MERSERGILVGEISGGFLVPETFLERGVWSSMLKPSELGPKAMNCTFWLLACTVCYLVKRKRRSLII